MSHKNQRDKNRGVQDNFDEYAKKHKVYWMASWVVKINPEPQAN